MDVWHLIHALYHPACTIVLGTLSSWLYGKLKGQRASLETDRAEVRFYESGAIEKIISEKIRQQ